MKRLLLLCVICVSLFGKDPSFKEGMVSINFDDGWLCTFNNAIPVLNKTNIRATEYLITEYLSTPYVTVEQARELEASGHEIGTHTKKHLDLSKLPAYQVNDQIVGSISTLEIFGLGHPKTLAYPYGNYDPYILGEVSQLKLQAARSDTKGFNTPSTNRFALNSFTVEQATTIDDVYAWIDQAIQDKLWAILVFHQVDNSKTEFSVTPEMFQDIITYIQKTKVKTVTNSEGAKLLK